MKLNILLLLAVLHRIHPIAVQLHPDQERCFKVEGGTQYEIQFVVAGHQQENLNFTIKNNAQIIVQKTNIKQYKDKVTLPAGINNLCFKITDDYAKMLIIDFFESTNLVKTLITKKDPSDVEEVLREAYGQFKTVYRNQQFQIERDKIHKALLEQTQGKIKYTGIFKIVIPLEAALVQVWVMKRFFNSRSREYQSVAS